MVAGADADTGRRVTDDIDPQLLTRYLSHRCTAEERRAVQAWAASSPARAAQLEHAQQIWLQAEVDAERWDVDAGWRAVAGRMRSGQRTPAAADRPARPASPRRFGEVMARTGARRTGWALAAAALIVAAGAALLHLTDRRAGAFVGGMQYATLAGETAKVRLSDGTDVMLAPESRLRLARGYYAGDRRVRLVGEALFAVVHDARHPFAVSAGPVLATDVGTRFDVRAYDSTGAVRVAVVEGAVSIATSRHPAARRTMTGGEWSVADDSTVSWGTGDVPVLTAWASGAPRFHNAPLPDVVADLSRWYGVEMTIGDQSLARRAVTLSTAGETRDQVLEALAVLVHAHVERRGTHITFTTNPLDQ
jgi:transmembrane sensor